MARVLLLALMALAATPGDEEDAATRTVLTGGTFVYAVRTGDTLRTISARLAVGESALVQINQLDRSRRLTAGQWLVVDNRHIATIDRDISVAINIAQRMLFLAEGNSLVGYPIAVGTRGWPTPVGAFTVVDKEVNPTWDVPPSIQAEMRQQGRPVVTRVPPSPVNPLGTHWIRLSFPGLGIHGTIAPASVYSFASHGCIRMQPQDMTQLFGRVSVGTAGVITYQPALIALIEGVVFLEAHPDVYKRARDPMTNVRGVAERDGFAGMVDWNRVAFVLGQQLGIAVDVTMTDE